MSKQKVIEYILKFDGEFYKSFSRLGMARNHLKDLSLHVGINNMPKTVELVKVENIYTTLNVYTPKPIVVMECQKAFDDIKLA